MLGRNISIHDIAEAAGVSHSTVSRALRNSPLISQDVRDSIRAIATRMGYVPNVVAQSLQGRRTRSIGVLVTTISDPFFADVVGGIEQAARPAGYSVLLAATHNDQDEEARCLDSFRARRVDGLIVSSSRSLPTSPATSDTPLVLINNHSERRSDALRSVSIDDRSGALQATQHLLALGHRKIGYIGVASRVASNDRRRQGYEEALAGAGLDPVVNVRVSTSMSADPEADVIAGRRLLPELTTHGVTGIVCYNDMVAVGVLMACRELDLRVAEDVSVVGFDDVAISRYITPQLTTVRQPSAELGRIAMQMTLALLDDKPVTDFVAQPLLLVRDSTRPYSRASQEKR